MILCSRQKSCHRVAQVMHIVLHLPPIRRPKPLTLLMSSNALTCTPDTMLPYVQDAVARRCKLCFLYKRPGQRVIINRRGDMLVRPTFIELTLNQTPLTTSVHDVSPLAAVYGISPSLVRLDNARIPHVMGRRWVDQSSALYGRLDLRTCYPPLYIAPEALEAWGAQAVSNPYTTGSCAMWKTSERLPLKTTEM